MAFQEMMLLRYSPLFFKRKEKLASHCCPLGLSTTSTKGKPEDSDFAGHTGFPNTPSSTMKTGIGCQPDLHICRGREEEGAPNRTSSSNFWKPNVGVTDTQREKRQESEQAQHTRMDKNVLKKKKSGGETFS